MKIVNRKISKVSHPVIKNRSLKILSTVFLGCVVSSAGYTSDLEIYQGATYGNAAIMMMLDNSGSMDKRSISNDYSAVYSGDSTSSETLTQYVYNDYGIITNDYYTYSVTYVEKGSTKYYDRMSRLKMALMPMFANPKGDKAFGKNADLSKYKIGLGSFYFKNSKNGGKIDNPVLDLTLENRKKLLATVKSLSASTNTPTADAYAEAGAYMLGASTANKSDDTKKIYKIVGESKSEIKDNGSYKYNLEKCTKNKSDVEKKYGIEYKKCDDDTEVQDDANSLNLGLLGGYDIQKTKKKEAYYFKRVSGSGNNSIYIVLAEAKIEIKDNGTYEYEIKKCTKNKDKIKNEYGIAYKECDKDQKSEGIANNISDVDSILNTYGYDLKIIEKEEVYYFRIDSEESTGSNASSGFGYSSDDTKVKPGLSKYDSPIKGEASQCDGYGVYFLTDGEPNTSTSDTIKLMENSLSGSPLTMGSTCESGLPSSGLYGEAARWECIGEYSRALYNKNNAKGTLIATATVGFGSVFEKLTNKGKISRTITRPSGVIETVEVYQCDAEDVNQDAKNLCKLGEKGEGYGEGGFYYTKEPEDIAKSVRSFIEDVSKAEIDPVSAGTMSVPLDSLGGLKSRKFAYLPILEPTPGSQRLWNGNLKKYNVVNGTLKGADNNFVFSDSTGLFANNTHDIWNTIIDDTRLDAFRPDKGLPQVGGAYQKVFENANAPIVGERNLFVDTGNSLANIRVANNNPVNFNSLIGYTDPQKLTLLSFMGYSEPTATTIADNTNLIAAKDKWSKNIGGVLHSVPQLITQSVAVDNSGQFDTSKRKDYIIYGSMDGALHMLDDSTGQETFTFVPKQILDLQPDALAGKGNGTAVDGSYPYGVDAPWLTYVAYTTKSKTEGEGEDATTTYSYEAAQSFALGGLRMGGSMYYALDVSNVKAPKMIYSVGSNYANRQKRLSTDISGTKNGVTAITSAVTATPDQKAYSRMGQTWGKPTLGYVKRDGKRVMVSFLPGGYDSCYENPQFKLGNNANSESCADKSQAQGNAVYMVQMGEVETDSTTQEETVKTSADSGNLLWWASNQGNSVNSTSRSTSLQYSKADDLKHSVVTQVRAIDRNYDGLTDHIYFADLGGQVWRADINNNKDTDTFKIDRVVKVLDVSDQATGNDAPPRIYERPLITFFNGKYGYNDATDNTGTYSGIQAMITVGTGDRSSPVSAERNTPDALYTVIDKDVSRKDLFYYGIGTAPTISLRTPVIKVGVPTDNSNRLQQLTFTNSDIGNTGIRQNMNNNAVQGWYMPFTYWDDAAVSTSKYKLKMFNEPDAIAGVLISSTYNPDEGQDIQACSAGVKGSTQRERTCLPFGSCSEDVVTPRSTFIAGSGIVDNIISQYNDTAVFSSLVNRCEGDDCKPDLICPDGNCGNYDDIFNECVGPSCGVESGINTDKRINPLSWLEH